MPAPKRAGDINANLFCVDAQGWIQPDLVGVEINGGARSNLMGGGGVSDNLPNHFHCILIKKFPLINNFPQNYEGMTPINLNIILSF